MKVAISGLDGHRVAIVEQFSGLEVTIPLNDARTCRLTMSLHDPAVAYVHPLEYFVKVTYGNHLIFWGPIVRPAFDFGAKTVQVDAHDLSLKLKHHYHRYGDYAVDVGYPIDGRGMRILVESAIPTQEQLDNDAPPLGILWGHDETEHQGPKPEGEPEEGDPLWRIVERGANVWESMQNLQQAIIGPDFRLRPVDGAHEGVKPAREYFYAELDTYDHLGDDLTDTIKFHSGWGKDTAESIQWEPDGDTVRNWWAQVYPGGERYRGDERAKAVRLNMESVVRYGIYQGWESSGQPDRNKVLEAKAKLYVTQFGQPLDNFVITPRMDNASTPVYARDFDVGDDIAAAAKEGYVTWENTGRIVSATLAQVDANGNTRLSLECLPTFTITEAEFDEWGL